MPRWPPFVTSPCSSGARASNRRPPARRLIRGHRRLGASSGTAAEECPPEHDRDGDLAGGGHGETHHRGGVNGEQGASDRKHAQSHRSEHCSPRFVSGLRSSLVSRNEGETRRQDRRKRQEETPDRRTQGVGDEPRHHRQASAKSEPDEVLTQPSLPDGIEMKTRHHPTPRTIIQSENVTVSQTIQHSPASAQTGIRCHRTPRAQAALYATRPTAPSAMDCASVATYPGP